MKNNTNNSHANTNNPTIPCSTPSLPCDPKAETNNTITFLDYSLTQNSVTLPTLSDFCYGPIINGTQNLSLLDPFHFSLPMVMDVSEFGANSMNSYTVSPSQEGSSISDSSSLAMDNIYLSLLSNGGLEDAGTLMDSGFSFPCDLVNGPLFQDKASEVTPNSYPYLADFGYPDIKAQGPYQGVINQY